MAYIIYLISVTIFVLNALLFHNRLRGRISEEILRLSGRQDDGSAVNVRTKCYYHTGFNAYGHFSLENKNKFPRILGDLDSQTLVAELFNGLLSGTQDRRFLK